MKTLAQIIDYLAELQPLLANSGSEAKVEICGLTLDSRKVDSGFAFIALQGEKHHGLNFLETALRKGAKLIIADRALTTSEQKMIEQVGLQVADQVAVLVVEHLSMSTLGEFAHWFYDAPTNKLKVIGITGTNGKTSTAFYSAQLLESQGQKVAVIGTLGNGALNDLQATANTTPDSVTLAKLFADFVSQGFAYVVMEVSSHAIALDRIAGIHFYITALTQIGSDHLDFHGTQVNYAATKLSLFADYAAQYRVVNLDDVSFREWQSEATDTAAVVNDSKWLGYSQNDQAGENIQTAPLFVGDLGQSVSSSWQTNLIASEVVLGLQGIELTLNTQKVRGEGCELAQSEKLSAGLLGRFNIENLLCALAILQAAGFANLASPVAQLTPVLGRMQIVHRQPTVVIDFAHTADGLQALLAAVKDHLPQTGRLWVVFGCGGDRDQAKRPQMAQVAQRFADHLVITSDNPRSESPESIAQQIIAGLTTKNYALQLDREQAIQSALQQAAAEDVVVIAGKGHEDYQEIHGVKRPFSDQGVVAAFYQASA